MTHTITATAKAADGTTKTFTLTASDSASKVRLGAYPGLWDNGKTPETTAARVARVNKALGPLRIARWYDQGTLAPQPDLQAAGIPTIYSSALPYTAVDGSYDAAIIAGVKQLKAGDYWTPMHEPENASKATGAQYIALVKHFYPLVKAANPGVKVVTILMNYTMFRAGGGVAACDAYYPGNAFCDVMVFDCYIRGTKGKNDTPANAIPSLIAYAKSKGKPLGFAEFGIDNTVIPDAQWAGIIKASLPYFQDPANNFEFVSYFETYKTESDGTIHDFRLETRADALALWKAAAQA